LLLAERGARLALTDINAAEGRALCEEIKQLGYDVDMVFATLDCTGSSFPLFRRFLRRRELMWGWKQTKRRLGSL
jgi:hypothetical protein